MACKLAITANAYAKIRSLPSADLGRHIRSLFQRIATDPVLMTKGISHGLRVWDGMVMAKDGTFYVQIFFAHAVGTGDCAVVDLFHQAASGPH